MSTAKILICCHKPDRFVRDEIYTPIHVGKAVSDRDLGIMGDDTGDNISRLNANFCELTGLYWAWKNLEPVDYVGLCHYRRYFNFHDGGDFLSDYSIVRSKDFDNLDLSLPDLDALFRKYDVVLSKPKYFPYSLFVQYAEAQVSEDLRTLCSVVHEKYPDFDHAMNEVLMCNNRLCPYNMMIMRWADFQRYCAWLFDILFAARERINIEHYNAVQARIWGYMGERLLSVWICHEQMKVKHYPVYWVNDEEVQQSPFTRMQYLFRRKLAFYLQNTGIKRMLK